MKLFHELSSDIILDHKGFFAVKHQGISAEVPGRDIVAQYTRKMLTFVLLPARIRC